MDTTQEFYLEILKPFMHRDVQLGIRLSRLVVELSHLTDVKPIGVGRFAQDTMQEIGGSAEAAEIMRRRSIAWAVSKRKLKKKTVKHFPK